MTSQEIVVPKDKIKNFMDQPCEDKKMNSKVHIIIPVFNEAKSIVEIINRIHVVMKSRYNYKITVIDDGSSDNTLKLLEEMESKINFLRNDKNLGKGETLKHGFTHANKNEIIVILDGDGEHRPEDIPKLIKPLLDGEADHVIGSRFLSKQPKQGRNPDYLRNKKKFNKLRYIGNSIITWMIYLLYQEKITDTQSGFRTFGPGVISKLTLKFSGFETETEMTLNLVNLGLRIVEIPIKSGLSTRESHMNIIRDSLRIFFVISIMKFQKEGVLKNGTKENSIFQRQLLENKILEKINQIETQKLKLSSYKLSIVIPCLNESSTIIGVIREIYALNLNNYEIIVVDDGSTDNSVDLLRNLKNVKLFIHSKNIGYGRTLIDGIQKASGDLIITIDSDGQHEPKDIPILCQLIIENNADIVVGSRYKGRYNYQIPFFNRAGEAFIEVIVFLIFGKIIKNNQGGFRVFHKRTLDIFKNLKFHGMAFTTEILMSAFLKNYRVVEGPINLYNRPIGKSRVKKIKLLLNLIICFLTYSFQRILRFIKK
ncbi:glycosyltransferase family 2 protein [Promethearchaeum syntrophicum]|uniref:Glycosyltransferase family 2 protein n=1 Tax=Promethearchaeum syntrophicum TaxID=2594042 RepID=A0A5B9D9U3_9ARCH|nr:glycosyltransferase family 2 protein [Candidatus Prometheoarchaeum syntrophicum]QEE16038.1 Glycosyltransferase AglJ [Candidatus Prometheoarchaeum syntrophicum]